jgi:hypothetical protein
VFYYRGQTVSRRPVLQTVFSAAFSASKSVMVDFKRDHRVIQPNRKQTHPEPPVVRGDFASRTCRAASCSSFLPPAAAAQGAGANDATVAAVLMEIVPDHFASQVQRVADAWIFWIWAMVALLTRVGGGLSRHHVQATACSMSASVG